MSAKWLLTTSNSATFELDGLPPAPRGVPQIEVTFDIDANGIVHVSAKDTATGKEQSMTISGGSTLNKEDIDRMMRDAEAHAEEDKQRREEAEVRNNAEALVYQTEKFLADNADKVPAEAKAKWKHHLKNSRRQSKKTICQQCGQQLTRLQQRAKRWEQPCTAKPKPVDLKKAPKLQLTCPRTTSLTQK